MPCLVLVRFTCIHKRIMKKSVGSALVRDFFIRTRRSFEDVVRGENTKSEKMIANICERMDELDGMYDDIQDRVFEIDKARKNNLVFYGVKGDEIDGDECEKRIKNIMATQLQVLEYTIQTSFFRTLGKVEILQTSLLFIQGDP